MSYKINDIYQGGISSFKPDYGDIFTGYHVSARQLGAPTKIDDVNQMNQVNMLLNQGIVPIEVGVLKPKDFESIPTEMFKEINRKAKLAGAKISVHAPIIEASGIGEQGYDEVSRHLAEKQLMSVVDRTAPMNEKGGMSITVHSSGLPGTQYTMTPKGKEKTRIVVVDRSTGKLTTAFKPEETYYPSREGEVEIETPEQQVEKINSSQWDNELSQLIHYKENADKIITQNLPLIPEETLKKLMQKKLKYSDLDPVQRQAFSHIKNAETYLSDAQKKATGLFDKAFKLAKTEDERKKLIEVSKEYNKVVKQNPTIQGHADGVQALIRDLSEIQPQLYEDVEDYALEHSAKTFGNVAFHAFEKYKDKAPVINIENFMGSESAFSMGDELSKLIKESRNKFVENAVKKGYSESEAKEHAEKTIGVTLDVGHLNVAKKHGFKDEDLLKEVAKISKDVKHVHLTDNFGSEDVHLIPGQGNVPTKEILKKLSDAGFKGTQVVEAAPGGVQLLGSKTFSKILEAMGSPVFANSQTPYWNQSLGLYQGYSGDFGHMLPQLNYETFGAGFSQLPKELGGQRQSSAGSRMSGRPME
jgi:sugar phosphate isomerase/epimerase